MAVVVVVVVVAEEEEEEVEVDEETLVVLTFLLRSIVPVPVPVRRLSIRFCVNKSTHLSASAGPWHTAIMASMSVPWISNAFFMLSVSSSRRTAMFVNGSLPWRI